MWPDDSNLIPSVALGQDGVNCLISATDSGSPVSARLNGGVIFRTLQSFSYAGRGVTPPKETYFLSKKRMRAGRWNPPKKETFGQGNVWKGWGHHIIIVSLAKLLERTMGNARMARLFCVLGGVCSATA